MDSISRIAEYYRRHGVLATVHRAWMAAKRAVFAGRMVVFWCDLRDRQLPREEILEAATVVRIRSLAELSDEHFQKMTSFWHPKQASRNIRERFRKGASLWILECNDQLAGYGWTLQGSTIEPYYFPLAKEDVHFFDFHVLPQFRGRGMNPYLVEHILDSLAVINEGRAFIEAAEWNEAQLMSLRKTRFRPLGSVKSFTILGRRFASWTRNDAIARSNKMAEPDDRSIRTARSNEH